jgi:hypothetical protein
MRTGHSISGGNQDRIEWFMWDDVMRQKLFFSKVQVRIVTVPPSTAHMRPSSSCRSCVGLRSAWFWRSSEDAWIHSSAVGRLL